MPTTGVRDEDRLIEQFLSVYETAAGQAILSRRSRPSVQWTAE
jgi:hypothetical protein